MPSDGPLSISERHVQHYSNCNCLADTDKCCVPTCPCHADEPLFDSFWIETDDEGGFGPCVSMLSCRRCGVHHILWADDKGEPMTLTTVIELAQQHGWCAGEPDVHNKQGETE